MELSKQPETEMEYWQFLEGLGGIIWSNIHDISHDLLPKSDAVMNEINEAAELSGHLLAEIGEKFGVIRPGDYPTLKDGEALPPAPEGKVYYWDWYGKLKHSFYYEIYENLICSACPFSTGLQNMINLGGQIPCGAVSGWFGRLLISHECGMVNNIHQWSKIELYREIREKSTWRGLQKFKKKEIELKCKPQKEPQ
jgi:hypothetical protein